MKVELIKLTKKFGGVTAVDNLNLAIDHGELVAFLGPSGCGKTTTLLMNAGIYRPTAGEILFGGKRVNELIPRDRDIGMVFQSYALYPHMNVYENIVFSLTLKKVPKEVRRRSQKSRRDAWHWRPLESKTSPIVRRSTAASRFGAGIDQEARTSPF